MKAVFIKEHGPPDVLKFSDTNDSDCSSGKIKVNIKNSSINHLDIWVRKGIPGLDISLPRILGSDGAGVVCEVGKGTKGFKVGDDVIIHPGVYDPDCEISKSGHENLSPSYGILGETHNGVQSEFVCLDPTNLYPMPAHLSYAEASSVGLTFMTAYEMLIKKARIQKDDLVLIYGGTSGVGSAGIQIAKDMGCRVISTVGSDDKIKYILDIGADHVVLHNSDLYSNLKRYLGRERVNVVFEHIGRDTWDTSMRVLQKGGRVVTCGATTGARVNINLAHLFFKNLSILGSTMGSVDSFKEVLNKINMKKYFPMVDQIFHASDIIKAHQYIENRMNIGKVVLDLS